MKGRDKLSKQPWLKPAWTPSSAHQLKSWFSSFCPLASKSTLSGTTSSLRLPCLPPPPHCFAVWVSPLSVHSHSSPASLTHPENTFSVTVLQHQSPPPLPKPTASPWPCHLASRFFFPTPFFFCLVPSVSLQTHIITKPSSGPHHPCPAAALLPPT